MKINSQRGMVLFVVLMILQIVALFSWVTLQSILLEKKSIQDELQMQDIRSISMVVLTQIENEFAQSIPNCFIPVMQPTVLMSKPLDWWRSGSTCAGNFHALQYYYVIELLGDDACAYLADTHETVDYYRITLLTLAKQAGNQVYLQSTVTKASHHTQLCASQSHAVQLGRQSWREFIE